MVSIFKYIRFPPKQPINKQFTWFSKKRIIKCLTSDYFSLVVDTPVTLHILLILPSLMLHLNILLAFYDSSSFPLHFITVNLFMAFLLIIINILGTRRGHQWEYKAKNLKILRLIKQLFDLFLMYSNHTSTKQGNNI